MATHGLYCHYYLRSSDYLGAKAKKMHHADVNLQTKLHALNLMHLSLSKRFENGINKA